VALRISFLSCRSADCEMRTLEAERALLTIDILRPPLWYACAGVSRSGLVCQEAGARWLFR
jgi:hypothetical protein